jgi:hypothetical protein
MLWILLGLIVAGVVVVVVGIRDIMQRYRKLFSDAHFQEVHARFVHAIEAVEAARASADTAEPSDAFMTSAQLAIVVTGHAADGRQVLHVSLSQRPGPTTGAAANRFAFFLLTILNRNKLQLNPFRTPSTVHHLVFTWDGGPLKLNDYATVMDHYRTHYQPLPFQVQAIADGGSQT